MDENDFEYRSARVKTDEGRARLVYDLVGGVEVPLDQILTAFEFYYRQGDLQEAAEIAERAQLPGRAIHCYLEDGYPSDAQRVAQHYSIDGLTALI